MKIHTSLSEDEVRECLAHAKDGGLVPADVVFDVFGIVGSRSYPHAFEVHLATAQRDSRLDDIKRKASSMAGSTGLKYAATYDEWGEFLAELFAADETAKAGPYKNQDDFHARTRYAYATSGELPEDAQTIENYGSEPEPEYASTAPVSDATREVIGRIDETLAGYWHPNHP